MNDYLRILKKSKGENIEKENNPMEKNLKHLKVNYFQTWPYVHQRQI